MTDHDELASFVIPSESLRDDSNTSIGSGSYGAVFEIRMNGLPCIAKRLHAILTSRRIGSFEDREAIHKRFRDECILLSRLRHPNIVQFLGVHYGKDRYDLTLVMERMHMDLETALKEFPNMSLPIKLRILLDCSCGLLYLHCQNPSIVHRDFTAANILLSPDMRVKVADLGVSKILDMSPHQLSKLTKCPGALCYMPPEALQRRPVYGVKLDVFSFGHLALYVVNQQFPEVYELGPDGYEALQKGTAQLEKRTVAIDMMGTDHCLHRLVTSCLQDIPEKRPTSSQVNSTLQDLATQHPVKAPHAIVPKSIGGGLGLKDAAVQTVTRASKISAENKALRSEIEMIRAEAVGYKKDFEEVISNTQQLIRNEKLKWTAKVREEMKREKESLEHKLHCTEVQLSQCRKLVETVASQNDTRAGDHGSNKAKRSSRLHSDSEVFTLNSTKTATAKEPSKQRPHSTPDHEISTVRMDLYQRLIEEESSSDEEVQNIGCGHWLASASDQRKSSPTKLCMDVPEKSSFSTPRPSNKYFIPFPNPQPQTLSSFVFPCSPSPIPEEESSGNNERYQDSHSDASTTEESMQSGHFPDELNSPQKLQIQEKEQVKLLPLFPSTLPDALDALPGNHTKFIDDVEVIHCDNSGGVYHNPLHGITLRIPEEAIPHGVHLEISIGVGLYGNFSFTSSLSPISAIVWLCSKTEITFLKPIEVTIPHFLDCTSTENAESLKMQFMKANHWNSTQFLPADGEEDFTSIPSKGVLRTRHFCHLCICAGNSPEQLKSRRFCIACAKPQLIVTGSSIYFYVLYFLPTCIEFIKTQLTGSEEGYLLQKPRVFKFSDVPHGVTAITGECHFSTQNPVTVTLQPTLITQDMIDFWQLHQSGELELMEQLKMYPPSMQLTLGDFSSCEEQVITMLFSGTQEPVEQMKIKIIVPTNKETLTKTAPVLYETKPMPALTDIPTVRQLYKLETVEKESSVRIFEILAPRWVDLALTIDFDPQGRHIQLVRKECGIEGPVACCMKVLMDWLEGRGGYQPPTWEKLLMILEVMEDNLASTLQKLLS